MTSGSVLLDFEVDGSACIGNSRHRYFTPFHSCPLVLQAWAQSSVIPIHRLAILLIPTQRTPNIGQFPLRSASHCLDELYEAWILREMLALLQVSVSKHATLKTDLDEHLSPLRANASQISRLVMNLVTKASEAIGDRDGTIHLSTRRAIVGQGSPQREHLPYRSHHCDPMFLVDRPGGFCDRCADLADSRPAHRRTPCHVTGPSDWTPMTRAGHNGALKEIMKQ